jgi:hypothetical protein
MLINGNIKFLFVKYVNPGTFPKRRKAVFSEPEMSVTR